jgi:hypothetical protein
MKNISATLSLFYSTVLVSHLFFATDCYPLDGDNKGLELLLGEITAVGRDAVSGKPKIILQDRELILSDDARVFNKKKELSDVSEMEFPFPARIIILLDEAGEKSVIRIRPHEE